MDIWTVKSSDPSVPRSYSVRIMYDALVSFNKVFLHGTEMVYCSVHITIIIAVHQLSCDAGYSVLVLSLTFYFLFLSSAPNVCGHSVDHHQSLTDV